MWLRASFDFWQYEVKGGEVGVTWLQPVLLCMTWKLPCPCGPAVTVCRVR